MGFERRTNVADFSALYKGGVARCVVKVSFLSLRPQCDPLVATVCGDLDSVGRKPPGRLRSDVEKLRAVPQTFPISLQSPESDPRSTIVGRANGHFQSPGEKRIENPVGLFQSIWDGGFAGGLEGRGRIAKGVERMMVWVHGGASGHEARLSFRAAVVRCRIKSHDVCCWFGRVSRSVRGPSSRAPLVAMG